MIAFLLSPIGRRVMAAVAIIAALWLAYQFVYQRGYHAMQLKCAAEATEALAHAAERQAERDAASAAATEATETRLAESLPAIEETTHEATERIRTVYRDRMVPVPADCQRPPDVLRELESARDRANAAARGMRSGTGGADTPDSD